jgi:hypothetical protein
MAYEWPVGLKPDAGGSDEMGFAAPLVRGWSRCARLCPGAAGHTSLDRVLQETQPRPLRIPNIVIAIDTWKTDERRIRTMRKCSDE